LKTSYSQVRILKITKSKTNINWKKLYTLGIIFLLLTSTLLIFIPKIEAQKRFSGSGSGTPWDPYVITNVKQLQEMKYDLRAYYVLGNDIDASETKYWNDGRGFEPIGDFDNRFTGSFDGRGYKIYNLYINTTRWYVGLFGIVGYKGIIKNVGLENATILSVGWYVGGLIGVNFGTVSNSYLIGSVKGGQTVGGLIGQNDGTVSNCYSTGSVKGTSAVGGLIGLNSGLVSNCYSTAIVNGKDSAGGLIGLNYYGTVSNSYSRTSVNGSWSVGGLIGTNNYGKVFNCYSRGHVNGNTSVGGLIGAIYIGLVFNCYSAGFVNGINLIGGLIGWSYYGEVLNSFWDIETSGLKTSVGGTGKTTSEMKNVRTYTDVGWSKGLESPWDFVGNPYDDKGNEDIWNIDSNINDGYPYLTTIKIGELSKVNAKAKGSNEIQWLLYIIFAGVIGGMIAVLFILIRKLKDLRLRSANPNIKNNQRN
jgi:hypothetical protein